MRRKDQGNLECVLEKQAKLYDDNYVGSLLEALILASTNPQYDKILLLSYMKSSEHVAYINCSECQKKTIDVRNIFWACNFHVQGV